MKIYQSVIFLAGAGALLCGCATAPARHAAGKAARASADTAATPEADDPNPVGIIAAGQGNAESLARYAAGVGYEMTGDHAKAMEEYNKSVLADPSNEPLAIGLTEEYLKEQHPDQAIRLLSRIAPRREASGAIFSWLARADLQGGKTNAALAASRQAIERQPDSLDGYESQLEVFAQTRKPAEALRTLDRASKHIRGAPGDLIGLAGLYAAYLSGQGKEVDAIRRRAVALLDRAAAMKLSPPELWERLGDTYGRVGETKKAAAVYAKLVAEAPESSPVRDALRERLGQMYLEAQDWTNAAAQFHALVRDDPAHYPGAWYYLGVIAHSEGNLADAADDFGNALRADPALEQAYYRLALVLADLHRGDTALSLLDQARARFPNRFDGEFFTGLVYSQMKDFGEAVRHFTAAEVMAAVNSPARLDREFYFQMGAACERNHQYADAERDLQKCIDMEPDDAEALNYLGFMWADRGEHLPKARAYIEKALQRDPKNGAYLDSMGWVLYKLKQPQQALPWMLKAVEAATEPDATVLDHLGDVYMALRQPDKAREAWKKSLSIESNDDVRKKLQLYDAGAT